MQPRVRVGQGRDAVRAVLWWAWRRLWHDRGRLWVLAGLLTAATTAAALPLASSPWADASLAQTLREAGARPWVVLRYRQAPGAAPPSPAALRGLADAVAAFAAQAALPHGPVRLLVATLPARLDVGAGGALGALPLTAWPDGTPPVRWVAGGPPVGPPRDGLWPAALPWPVWRSGGVVRGEALTAVLPGGAALRLRAVGAYAPGPAWPGGPGEAVWVPAAALWTLGPRQVASLQAAVSLRLSALRAPGAPRLAEALAALARRAERRVPGTTLAASPAGALARFLATRALWSHQVALAAAGAVAAAVAAAVLGAFLAAWRDRPELDLWLARGAPAAHVVGVYAVEWGTLAAVAVAAGPPLAALALRLAGLGTGGDPAVGLGAAFLAAAAVEAVGALAAWAGSLGALGPSPGETRLAARRPLPPRTAGVVAAAGLAVAALGAYGALTSTAAVRRAAAAALYGGRGWDPLSLEPAGLVLVPLAILLGLSAALVFAPLAWAGGGRRVPRGPVAAVVAVRRLLRPSAAEAAALALVAFAVGGAVLAASARASYRATWARAAAVAVGAPVRLVERVPPPCDALVDVGGLRCLDRGREVPLPRVPAPGPPWLGWPVPPDPDVGLPGVAVASRVFAVDLPAWPPGTQPVRYVLVDPASYGRAALWPTGVPGTLAAYLQDLARDPGGVLVVGGAAALPGAEAGTYLTAFPCLVDAPDCPPEVVGTPALWPGWSPRGPALVVGAYGAAVPGSPISYFNGLADELGGTGPVAGPIPDLPPAGIVPTASGDRWQPPAVPPWPLGPLTFQEFLRLRPGASLAAVLRGLRARGVQVVEVLTPERALAAALGRPEAQGRLALWRLATWGALLAAALLAALMRALGGRAWLEERALLRALGTGGADVVEAAWAEALCLLAVGAAAGLLAGAAAARLTDGWLAAFASSAPVVPPAATVVGVRGLPAAAAVLAAAWAAAAWAGHSGRARAVATRPAGPPRGRLGVLSGLAAAAGALVRARAAAEPLPTLVLAASLGTAALLGAGVGLAVSGGEARLLQAVLVPQDGRPPGAVLLMEDATGPGRAAGPGSLARLAAAASRLPALTGRPASPVATVTESATMALYPDANGQPAGAVPQALAQLVARPGLAAHVVLEGGRLPGPPEPGGILEVAVTPAASENLGVRLGGRYDLVPAPGYGPPVLPVRVVGVFEPRHPQGAFWPLQDSDTALYVAPETLQSLTARYPRLLDLLAAYRVLDLGGLRPGQVPRAARGLERVVGSLSVAGPSLFVSSPLPELEAFLGQAAALRAALGLLALPALLAVVLLAALAADAQGRAGREVVGLLGARGSPWSVRLASELGATVALAAPACAAGTLGGALAGWAGGLRPVAAAVPGAVAATALAVAAAVLAATLRRRGPAAHRGPTAGWPWLEAALTVWFAYEALTLSGWPHGGPARGAAALPGAAFALSSAGVLAVGLWGQRAVRLWAAAAERRRGAGWGVPELLARRRLAREPGRWVAIWLLSVFALGQGAAALAARGAVAASRALAAGLSVGAEVNLVEGWSTQCVPLSYSFGGPTSASPYARFQCAVGYRSWGASVFAYQLPPPPPVPFAANAALPGVRAATPLVSEPGGLAVPGGTAAVATVVGVDPRTFAAAAWWRAGVDPLPLRAYLQGLAAGKAFVDQGWLRAHGLGAGEVVDLTVAGRTLPVAVAGPVVRWPGVAATGPLVVVDAGWLVHAFSLKLPYYDALLRLDPGASPARLAQALVADRMFVIGETTLEGAEQAGALDPTAQAIRGLLPFLVVALDLAGALGAVLLLVGTPEGAEDVLLRALGLDGEALARAGREELGWLLAAGAVAAAAAAWVACVPLVPLVTALAPGAPPVPPRPGPAVLAVEVALFGLAGALGAGWLRRRAHRVPAVPAVGLPGG